jgi:hypothetical protein
MSAPQKKKAVSKKTKDLPESNVEMPNVETPIVETPIVETPIVETPITEIPITESEQIEPILTSDQIVNEIKQEIEEEIKEKIDEVITVKVPLNLVDLVKEEIKQKAHILNKEYIDILNSLVGKSPKLLNDIERAMFEITKDGKIDSNDIPFLITIIQKLYEFMFSLKIGKIPTEKRAAICGEIIKFVVVVLIKERRIKVDVNKQDAFIAQINVLMDSCVSLLSLQSTLLSRGCCSCFFSKK